MDSNKIKDIWKANITEQIDNYTDAEIETIVLKNARMAIRSSSMKTWEIVAFAALTPLLIWFGSKYAPTQMNTFWLVLIALNLCAIFIVIYSRVVMQRYSYDMPLKEWIEKRIGYLDKSINRKKGYWIFMSYGCGLLILIFFQVLLKFTAGASWQSIGISFSIGLVTLIIVCTVGTRIMMKRLHKARKNLQELYDQLLD